MLRRSLLALVCSVLGFASVRGDLAEYLNKPEPAFSWKLKDKKELDDGTIYTLHLVSQTWQKMNWEHDLVVYYPKGVKPTETMLLWNTGGKSDLTNALLGMQLAGKLKAPAAFLFGIPNQPLFEGKREDALIAETFVKYLETKDESWPLLFPMTKSVIKSMDALQAFFKEQWKFEVKQFVVSGASKRGWTSWLTGASGDKRVKAIAPLVIDTLNMQQQLPHQLKSYGKPSQMIHDYVERKLVPIPDSKEAKKLWSMVDPWVYRDSLKLPKLIVNGANDPYWTQDALNLYWDDLAGDKWVLYVPNAGHGLEQTQENGKKDRDRAINTLCAFIRAQITNKPLPKLNWKHEETSDLCRVTVKSDSSTKTGRLWVADSETRDFRQSKWTAKPVSVIPEGIVGEVSKPANGYRVYFGECEYDFDGITCYLSSQLRIVEAKK
jgi:PhoPQ-activated pathogenicity-related protein